jgi:hypothetical protein
MSTNVKTALIAAAVVVGAEVLNAHVFDWKGLIAGGASS